MLPKLDPFSPRQTTGRSLIVDKDFFAKQMAS